MEERKKFVFLAHWVENWNWLLWWIRDLHRNPQHAWYWMWLWPVCAIASLFYLFGKKAYDEVDSFSFNGKLDGKTLLIRNFGWQFLVAKYREKIRCRILAAVRQAQKETDVIGLGALIKAEWLTQGGQWIVNKLGNELKVPIVHGDTLTAAVMIKRILQIIKEKKINSSVFITGATSKIGRAVVLDLAKRGLNVFIETTSPKRFKAIRAEAGEFGSRIRLAKSLAEGKDCLLWVTGKSMPGGKKLMRYFPVGATIVNFSVPNPIHERLFAKRPDLNFYEGGLLAYNPQSTDLAFTMRLWPGITYACHAGTMVHAFMGWTHNEVSQVNMSELWVVWRAAQELGFFLPPLPKKQEQEVREFSLWGAAWQKAKGFASFFS